MHVHIRMRLGHGLRALGRGDDADVLDPLRAPALQDVDRRRGRPAGREHRVQHQAQLRRRRRRQLVVVLDRSQGAFVAEQPDVPDLRLRDQLQCRVDHADAGAKHRDESDLLRQAPSGRRRQRRLHYVTPQLEVGRCLVEQKHRDLAH